MTADARDERIRLLRSDFQRVVAALGDALAHPGDKYARDSALLHFNLAYEVSWKLLQSLAARDGVDVISPRAAFEFALRSGMVTDEVVWATILRKRNEAVQLYRASMAAKLYGELPEFFAAFRALESGLKQSPAG